eukprot:Selendium_serpulae@DN4200_c0_g1_i2.p1
MIFSATFVHSLIRLKRQHDERKALRKQANALYAQEEEIMPFTPSARKQTFLKDEEALPLSPAARKKMVLPSSLSKGFDDASPVEDINVTPVKSAAPTDETEVVTEAEEAINADRLDSTVVTPVLVVILVFDLVIVPSVILGVVVALKHLAPLMLPSDNLATVVLIVSSAMPNANIMLIVCHSLGLTKEAQRIAYVTMFNVSIALVTTPIWCVIGLCIFPVT